MRTCGPANLMDVLTGAELDSLAKDEEAPRVSAQVIRTPAAQLRRATIRALPVIS